MTAQLPSLLPKDDILELNLISIDNFKENSDTLSLKSCPAFRPSRMGKKGDIISENKTKCASSSSLSEIRDGPFQFAPSKHAEPPDNALKEDVKALIESEWKRRMTRRLFNLTGLQILARKQQAEELYLRGAGKNISGKIGLETLLQPRATNVSENDGTAPKGDRKCYANRRRMYGVSGNDKSEARDSVSFSSKSCTIFGEKRVTQNNSQSYSVRASKSVQDDVIEPGQVTETPALGVQELRRRFSVRAKAAKAWEENDRKNVSKLTQTSITDAPSAQTHLTVKSAADFRKQRLIPGITEDLQRSWSFGTAEKEICHIAEELAEEKGRLEGPQTARHANMSVSDSITVHNGSLPCEEIRATLASRSERHQHFADVSQLFSNNIIPPPPEFDSQSPITCLHEPDTLAPNVYPCEPDYDFPGACQSWPNSGEKLTSELSSRPSTATKQTPRPQPTAATDVEPKTSRPASTKASSRTTRNRCTQTTEGSRAGRRRRRRVTYSPSDVSGPSDQSGDRWSEDSDRGLRLGRGRGRRAARRSGQGAPPLRPAGSRPVSGRSSQAAGGQPVGGRSSGVVRPPLVEEVHRKASGHKRGVRGKRRRSRRKVLRPPRNMPEAIACFLEQLSKDKEAIRVIHKMSLVNNKRIL